MNDPHQRLRENVSMLGGMLGDAIRAREGDALFDTVERIRRAAKEARQQPGPAVPLLEKPLRDLPLEMAVPVARAFSHFLTLANIAEQHHRVRRRRDYARGHAGRPQEGSFDEALPRLLRDGAGRDELYRAICGLRIALVITAHPTAITRRTLAATHARIARLLDAEDRPDLSAAERDDVLSALRREILIMWGSDDLRRQRPSPMDEVRSGLYVFEQTVWEALPRCLRALDRALQAATGFRLPLDAAPIVFGSWIGGDRDGNPSITAQVTRDACAAARELAAALYARELDVLADELSITPAIPELVQAAGGAREPYRSVLREQAAATRRSGMPDDRTTLAPAQRRRGQRRAVAGVSDHRQRDRRGHAERRVARGARCGARQLLVGTIAPASALGVAAALLDVHATLLGRPRRFRFVPPLRANQCAADQVGEAFARVLAVLRLRTVCPRVNDDHAFVCHAAARDRQQPLADVFAEPRSRRIEPQLDRGRDFVDVLSAGP